jgi:UDP-N-acetylmuramate: L-alanyl-gamma-D-glutamyl-meso-diaminopimelate ligase
MRVHMVGVSGTGMGSLAALFLEAGHSVSGSDVAFDPPIGPALRAMGVECLQGWDPKHLEPAPDLVVVGNVIRPWNEESKAAEERGLARTSMSAALRDHFLVKRKPLVVAGTHGKTTTSAMCAWILSRAERDPGWFIGGIPKDLGKGAAIGRAGRSLLGGPSPFVIEGDEYDSVWWIKRPKLLDYVGVGADDVAIVTSIEHDHIDIYADEKAYDDAFRMFARVMPEGGLFVCDARDPKLRALLPAETKARITWYALEGDDTGDVTPTWHAAPAAFENSGAQTFDVFAGGVSCGRFAMGVPGAHNVRNALGAIAACAEGFGVPVTTARTALASFTGVKRRQDLIGEPRGIRVYDDFAHHPTAVKETLAALRARHPKGALWAVFEARSATACRNLHQDEYGRAFGAATHVVFAPLGRANLPESERLDLARLAKELGPNAHVAESVDAIVARLAEGARPGDTIALLSNGSFGGIHARVLAALEQAP